MISNSDLENILEKMFKIVVHLHNVQYYELRRSTEESKEEYRTLEEIEEIKKIKKIKEEEHIQNLVLLANYFTEMYSKK